MPKKKQKMRRLTAKQKAFVALFPKVTAGEITVEQALKKAGYSDQTARQQTKTVDAVRNSVWLAAGPPSGAKKLIVGGLAEMLLNVDVPTTSVTGIFRAESPLAILTAPA